MIDPNDVMEALKAGLADALPDLLATREFKPMAVRSIDELEQGVMTLVHLGERDYANYVGREADLGTTKGMLIVQFKVAENLGGLAIEQREIVIAQAIKKFLAGPLPAPVADCTTQGYQQSGQLEAPFGWVAFELEIRV